MVRYQMEVLLCSSGPAEESDHPNHHEAPSSHTCRKHAVQYQTIESGTLQLCLLGLQCSRYTSSCSDICQGIREMLLCHFSLWTFHHNLENNFIFLCKGPQKMYTTSWLSLHHKVCVNQVASTLVKKKRKKKIKAFKEKKNSATKSATFYYSIVTNENKVHTSR